MWLGVRISLRPKHLAVSLYYVAGSRWTCVIADAWRRLVEYHDFISTAGSPWRWTRGSISMHDSLYICWLQDPIPFEKPTGELLEMHLSVGPPQNTELQLPSRRVAKGIGHRYLGISGPSSIRRRFEQCLGSVESGLKARLTLNSACKT